MPVDIFWYVGKANKHWLINHTFFKLNESKNNLSLFLCKKKEKILSEFHNLYVLQLSKLHS